MKNFGDTNVDNIAIRIRDGPINMLLRWSCIF